MVALRVQLPEELKSYIDDCIAKGDHANASAYIAGLVRAEQKRRAEVELLALVRQAEASGPATPMTRKDWEAIRRRGLTRIASERKPHAKRRQKAGSGR